MFKSGQSQKDSFTLPWKTLRRPGSEHHHVTLQPHRLFCRVPRFYLNVASTAAIQRVLSGEQHLAYHSGCLRYLSRIRTGEMHG